MSYYVHAITMSLAICSSLYGINESLILRRWENFDSVCDIKHVCLVVYFSACINVPTCRSRGLNYLMVMLLISAFVFAFLTYYYFHLYGRYVAHSSNSLSGFQLRGLRLRRSTKKEVEIFEYEGIFFYSFSFLHLIDLLHQTFSPTML